MVETWVVPELGTSFPNSFAKMLIDYIYDQWSYNTGNLAKPADMQGQNNKIEFRPGLRSAFKQLAVWTLQNETAPGRLDGGNPFEQIGYKRISYLTGVEVTLKAVQLKRDDPDPLHDMEKEIIRICGQYKNTNTITGIKDIRLVSGRREYTTTDNFDKSDWYSINNILMWYELVDVSA